MSDGFSDPLIPSSRRHEQEYSRPQIMKSDPPARTGRRRVARPSWVLVLSYAFDWAVLVAVGVAGYVLGNTSPNKRPFSLQDRDISFPFTVHETVPVEWCIVAAVIGPIVIIAFISLVFVPGATVPGGTPKRLIWERKLWELHVGWLGLAMSVVSAFFITNGMKNMCGKPRPDLIARCQPDLANLASHIVGGIANTSSNGQLVSANICTNPDKDILDDGFRSYPSGHASGSASGLIYLSLFIASKFAITIPFFTSAGYQDGSAFTAFPSRMDTRDGALGPESYEMTSRGQGEALSGPLDPAALKRLEQHGQTVAAVRRQAAAAPLYLVAIAVIPWFTAIFISSSRWFDFRHHGFDILFGFLIGTVTAFFSFRYYHLPISQGAGWAWGPRSTDKAWWAGIGSFSYATDHQRSRYHYKGGDEEEGLGSRTGTALGSGSQHSQHDRPHGDDRISARQISPPPPDNEVEATTYVGTARLYHQPT